MDRINWKPDINRLITTLNGGIPDRVPNFEILIEARNTEALLGRAVGNTLGSARGATDESYIAPPMNPKDYLELVQIIGQDAIGLEALWAPFKTKDHKGDLHIVNDGSVKSWGDFEKLILPTWELDFEPRKKYIEEYVVAAKGTGVGVVMMTGAFLQSCYEYLFGFNNFCILLYEERELIEKCLDIAVDYYIKIVEIAVDAGLDILYLADDVAYKSGSFIRPSLFKELWLERAKKIMAPAKAKGIPIMFHSCGNVTEILDDVICEMGINCLNPIEPYSMDIYAVKAKYQDRFCIAGNIDIAGPLAFGTPKESYEETANMIQRLKVGGRYILSSSHSITDDIPPENYQAMIQAQKDYSLY
jgi:uroporphyrinogen decarboxylase